MKKSRFREEQMVTILRCRRSRVGEWAVSDPCPRGPFPGVVGPRPNRNITSFMLLNTMIGNGLQRPSVGAAGVLPVAAKTHRRIAR